MSVPISHKLLVRDDGDPRTSGPGFGLTCHPHMLDQPLRWRRPRRIFVNSMSDLFHPAVPDEFIAQVFAVMACAPQHTFQVLTKRPQRMWDLLTYYTSSAGVSFTMLVHDAIEALGHREACYDSWPLPNVWLGTSIESDTYTFRANYLRATPAAVRFVSAEPLLGPLPSLDLTGIDWLIVGGESGPGARPVHPDWVRDLRDRCCPFEHPCAGRCLGCGAGVDEACIPPCACDEGEDCAASLAAERARSRFFFKQWGAWAPINDSHGDTIGRWVGPNGSTYGTPGTLADERELMSRFGKKAAGRELDGRTWDEMPA